MPISLGLSESPGIAARRGGSVPSSVEGVEPSPAARKVPPGPPRPPAPPTTGEDGRWPERRRRADERGERASIGVFLREIRAELRKFAWTEGARLRTVAAVTLLFVVVAAAYVFVLDSLFSRVISEILE